jgi:hypothetical protein
VHPPFARAAERVAPGPEPRRHSFVCAVLQQPAELAVPDLLGDLGAEPEGHPLVVDRQPFEMSTKTPCLVPAIISAREDSPGSRQRLVIRTRGRAATRRLGQRRTAGRRATASPYSMPFLVPPRDRMSTPASVVMPASEVSRNAAALERRAVEVQHHAVRVVGEHRDLPRDVRGSWHRWFASLCCAVTHRGAVPGGSGTGSSRGLIDPPGSDVDKGTNSRGTQFAAVSALGRPTERQARVGGHDGVDEHRAGS